jgi:ankyrin repeat protein
LVILRQKIFNPWKIDVNGDNVLHIAARKFNITEIRKILKTLDDREEKERYLLMKNKVEESCVDILKK